MIFHIHGLLNTRDDGFAIFPDYVMGIQNKIIFNVMICRLDTVNVTRKGNVTFVTDFNADFKNVRLSMPILKIFQVMAILRPKKACFGENGPFLAFK